MAKYTGQIKEKAVDLHQEILRLKVQFISDEAVVPFRDPEKIAKKGEPRPRFPTLDKTFLFNLPVTASDVKNAIKDKAKMLEDTEDLDLPLNEDIV